MFDSHCHLNFSIFDERRDEIIHKGLQSGLEFIVVGTNFATSKKAVEIGEKYSWGVYSSVGLHPMELNTGLVKIKGDIWGDSSPEKTFNYSQYKKLAKSLNVVAIGEIGLDYYIRPKTTRKKEIFKKKQKDLLLQELKLSKELNLPVIFHCRMANQDLINILEDKNIRPSKAVIHSFVGSQEELHKYLSLGYYIGFNGIIFKTIEGVDFKTLISFTPLNRILLETDSPYLKLPQFKEKFNNPLAVKYIAERVAEIKHLTFDKVAQVTTENTKSLFGL